MRYFQFTMPGLSEYYFDTTGTCISKRRGRFGIKIKDGKYKLWDDTQCRVVVTFEEIIAYGKHKEQELKCAFGLTDTEVIIIRHDFRPKKRIRFKCKI